MTTTTVDSIDNYDATWPKRTKLQDLDVLSFLKRLHDSTTTTLQDIQPSVRLIEEIIADNNNSNSTTNAEDNEEEGTQLQQLCKQLYENHGLPVLLCSLAKFYKATSSKRW